MVLPAFAAHPSGGEVRQKLDDIFSRPEFTEEKQNNLWTWLAKVLSNFFRWLGTLHEAVPVLFWIILISCLVLLFLLVIHIVWTLRRVFGLGSKPAGLDVTAETRKLLSQSFLKQAQQCAGRLDFTEAIRFLFLSLIYRFDETGNVSFQKSYTNREYLDLFADRQRVYGDLKVFVDTLDDHWYGQVPTDRQNYEHCWAIYQTLTSVSA